MTTFASVEGLREATGTELASSDWIVISQEMIDTFGTLTGDRQWIHVDVERAAASPTGSTIAHGYLVLALVAPTVMESLQIADAEQLLNYGMNRVRFPSPVRAGSRVRTRVTLRSVTDAGAGRLVTADVVVEIEGQDKPACVAEVLTYVSFPSHASEQS